VIRAFAGDYLNELSRHIGWRKVFADEAVQALCRYAWPGNLIELRNAVECAFLAGRDAEIGLHDLPIEVASRV